MTFSYTLVLPATGANKIERFRAWSRAEMPDIEVSLPQQVPVGSTALTVRLKSIADRDALKKAFPPTLP